MGFGGRMARKVWPVFNNDSRKQNRGAEALRSVLSKQANQPLRHQSGSEGRGGSDDSNANMTCKSCLFIECSGRVENIRCERYVYEPGSEE